MRKRKLITDSNNVIRYVDKNGVIIKSRWLTAGGKRYYFDKNGNSLKKMRSVAGKYYYFHARK